MTMPEFLRKEVNKQVKEIYKNTNKQWDELKTAQDMKVEPELIKKTQTEGKMEINNLETRTGTSEASLTNWIQEME